jgi:uncharacterized protein YprB with RNaseH-like and TPR domain
MKFTKQQASNPHVITWNGYAFDLPFVFIRAMLLNIPLPAGCLPLNTLCKKYQRGL